MTTVGMGGGASKRNWEKLGSGHVVWMGGDGRSGHAVWMREIEVWSCGVDA